VRWPCGRRQISLNRQRMADLTATATACASGRPLGWPTFVIPMSPFGPDSDLRRCSPSSRCEGIANINAPGPSHFLSVAAKLCLSGRLAAMCIVTRRPQAGWRWTRHRPATVYRGLKIFRTSESAQNGKPSASGDVFRPVRAREGWRPLAGVKDTMLSRIRVMPGLNADSTGIFGAVRARSDAKKIFAAFGAAKIVGLFVGLSENRAEIHK
jgi:hypothetical protein